MSSAPLHQSTLQSLPLLGRGKVRDNYAVGEDRLLIVTTDRLSAFDVVMGEPIPDKGRVLNRMTLFWLKKLGDVVPHHLLDQRPEAVVAESERGQVAERSMVVRRLRPILVEAVVRGYLIGSGWKDYQQSEPFTVATLGGHSLAMYSPRVDFSAIAISPTIAQSGSSRSGSRTPGV